MSGYSPEKNALAKASKGRCAVRCEKEVFAFWARVADGVAVVEPLDCEPLGDYPVDPTQDREVLAQEHKDFVTFAFGRLPKRTRQILILRWFMEQQFSNIGPVFGICSARAQQIEKKALRTIRHNAPFRHLAAIWHRSNRGRRFPSQIFLQYFLPMEA